MYLFIIKVKALRAEIISMYILSFVFKVILILQTAFVDNQFYRNEIAWHVQ